MADLGSLIKFRKHGLDEKRRFIAQLYREAEKLDQQKKAVEEQMAREIELANAEGSAQSQSYLGKYLDGARRKLRGIEAAIKKMDTRIAAAQEDMRAAFAEMKKVEIVQRTREERAEKEQKKKESDELDEVALDGYRRRLEDDVE